MPNDRTDKPRDERGRQPRPDLKLPQPAQQIAHPLIGDGPEAVRDSHC